MKKIVTLCDMCVDLEQESPDKVETYTLSINGQSLSCDLCDPCHETWLGNVWEALSAVGRKPTDPVTRVTKKVSKEIVHCADCNRDFSPAGFKNHNISKHQKVTLQVVSVDKSGSYKCGEKGCDRAFTSSQGLSLHRFRSHGIKGSERKAS